MFGILSVVLAVLKLAVAEHWSWSRVILPGIAQFLCRSWIVTGFEREQS
jgi:hypothetical protein